MRHSMKDLDLVKLTGECSVCGPDTPLKSNYRGGYRCRNKFNENRNLGRASGTHKKDIGYGERYYDGKARSKIVEELLPLQNNRCAICLEEFVKSPCVDHDHATGKVRGLLCSSCNIGIGYLRDDIRLLNSAVVYLS